MPRKYANPNLVFPTEEEIENGSGEYPKIGNMPVYAREYKQKGKVYIVDDTLAYRNAQYGTGLFVESAGGIQEDETFGDAEDSIDEVPKLDATGQTITGQNSDEDAGYASACEDDLVQTSEYDASPHKAKCTYVRRLFSRHTVYAVQKTPQISSEEFWDKYWETEMGKWKEDDLIIIYYHGWASGNGKDYTWNISNFGDTFTINAYNFLNKLTRKRGTDIMLMLECYLPTRFGMKDGAKTKLVKQTRTNKHSVEVICNGQTGQTSGGEMKYCNFTDRVLQYMERIANAEKRLDLGIHCPKEAFSIPQLMSADEEFDSNPYRLWLTKTSNSRPKKGTLQTWRMRIDPMYPGDNNFKLAFHMDCIQDTAKAAELKDYKEQALAREKAAEAAENANQLRHHFGTSLKKSKRS